MSTEQQLQNWKTRQAAWADVPAERRRSMMESSIVPDVIYTDPDSVSQGYDEVTVKMTEAQQNFPGCSFRQDKFRSHHDQAISEWTMLNGDGQPIFTGVSYARFGSDNRLTAMIGFFEPVVA